MEFTRIAIDAGSEVFGLRKGIIVSNKFPPRNLPARPGGYLCRRTAVNILFFEEKRTHDNVL